MKHRPTLLWHKHHHHWDCQQHDKTQHRAVNIGNVPPSLSTRNIAQTRGRNLHKNYRQHHQQNWQQKADHPHALADTTASDDKLQRRYSEQQHHGHRERHHPHRHHANNGNDCKENGRTTFSVGIAGYHKGSKEEYTLDAYRRTMQGNKRQPYGRNNAKRNPRLVTPSPGHHGGKQRHQPQQQRLYQHARCRILAELHEPIGHNPRAAGIGGQLLCHALGGPHKEIESLHHALCFGEAGQGQPHIHKHRNGRHRHQPPRHHVPTLACGPYHRSSLMRDSLLLAHLVIMSSLTHRIDSQCLI